MNEEIKRGKGQPEKFLTPEQKSQVQKLASVLSKAQLAAYFGMCENTYRRLEKEDETLLEAYKKGKAVAIASVAGNLINSANSGNTAAAIFFLKTQAGWKETQVVEVAEVKSFNDMYNDETEGEVDENHEPSEFNDMYEHD